MKQQRRDFASDGFFNSPQALAVFTFRFSEPQSEVAVSVSEKKIGCYSLNEQIYLFNKSDAASSADEINEALRAAAASANSYVRVHAIKRLKNLTDKMKPDRRVRAVHPDFVEVGERNVDRPIRTSTDLDDLPQDIADFLRLSTPYKSSIRILDQLVAEAGKFYLPDDEVKQLRELANRLSTEKSSS
jgi:hypothetical protein